MVQNLHHAYAAQIIDQSLSAFLSLPSVNESLTCSIIFLGILGVNSTQSVVNPQCLSSRAFFLCGGCWLMTNI